MKLQWKESDRWIAKTEKGQYEIFTDVSNNQTTYKPFFIIKPELKGYSKVLKKTESIQDAIIVCENHYKTNQLPKISLKKYIHFIVK